MCDIDDLYSICADLYIMYTQRFCEAVLRKIFGIHMKCIYIYNIYICIYIIYIYIYIYIYVKMYNVQCTVYNVYYKYMNIGLLYYNNTAHNANINIGLFIFIITNTLI